MYGVSKEFHFSAAHRIEGHPKCGRLHGHNYVVNIDIVSDEIPEDGMLVDYGKLSELMKPLIEGVDHRYIVSNGNLEAEDPYAAIALLKGDAFKLPFPASTAEFIAQHFHEILQTRYPDYYITVTVSETEKTEATYWRSNV